MLGRGEVNQLLDTHGLEARKALGQNFVVDPQVVMRIAQLARVGSGDRVVEIGPGLGSLTLALHETGASVLAIEKDESLVPVLRSVLDARGAEAVRIITADALESDWTEILGSDQAAKEDSKQGGPGISDGEQSRRWSLVANLPYNVAVAMVMDVLENAPMVERMLLMVQAEVADRLAASPGGRTIGIPSIQLGWYATAERVGTIDPDAFVPKPNVTSALIEIVRRTEPSDLVTCSQMMTLVADAYRHRRKMLRSTLSRRVESADFERAGVPPTARPEELGVADWVRLTEAVYAT
ncbi:MAG TPA: 16S rRNA (adenine(1518)-N(6)/adenine(1519)-N(6))-dimethyltransferase RsmA [Microthrixaceae bacterium]|nr:16S rRNA (adenine(1518)-N(6)/adenine(1519)-N(6))-dimethyltransferase RsmA [Microthrixaceae bacterium]